MDYRIDLTGIGNRADLHDRLQEALPLPVWYGRNLDAFYDCLTEQAEECCPARLYGCPAQALQGCPGGE